MIPALIPTLLEAALRAVIMALTVRAGLRLLRVGNVIAQKATWGLVLVGAVAMPVVMRWQWLPASAQLRLTAPAWHRPADPSRIAEAAQSPRPMSVLPSAPLQQSAPTQELGPPAGNRYPAPTVSSGQINPPARTEPIEASLAPLDSARRFFAPQASSSLLEPGTLAVLLYLAVCSTLLLRLLYGFGSAVKLWLTAEPVSLQHGMNFVPALRLRASPAVSSPVTIGSGVVLPSDYAEWDAEKLRIVLAHERSHIRQGDFYLQLLAGTYAVLFWFSPLGWWLKRKLSDLGEAISDRAGLEEAASRTSYAQVLLEFAALPRPTLIGVAMARTSNLSQRIERLLNDSIFHQAFAGSRRRILLAVMLVPVALFAATALVRVEAAGQSQQPAPPSQPAAPLAGQSNPDQAPELAMPPAPQSPASPVAPVPPIGPGSTVIPAGAPVPPAPPEPPDSDDTVIVGRGQTLTISQDKTITNTNNNGSSDSTTVSHSSGPGYSYSYRSNGDSWALVTDPSEHVTFSGDWHNSTREQIEKVRKLTTGKFLWFTHDGKSYFIDDQVLIAQIQAMYKPMEELGRQQEELGKKQEELGRQQEELGRKQEQASVPTPDMSKEMAELNAAMAKLQPKKGSTITEDELGDIQGKIGEIQGRLGELQGEMGAKQGEFGAQQGKLGAMQGELGAEQGHLGAEQGRIAEEADQKVKSIINESLRNGKARPVE